MSEDVTETKVPLDPETVLPDTVLDDIASQLGLKPLSEDVREELHIVVRRYTFDLKIFGSYKPELRSVTADYKPLKKKVSAFRDFLEQAECSDLASDLYLSAFYNNEPAPETEFPEITDFERTNGTPYLLELKRLLYLLEDATDMALEKLALPEGREPDYPLVGLVRRLAYIWEELLDKKFTIDYHKGSGLTPAFEFVSLLVPKIVPTVREQDIVNAMRTIVAELNKKAPNSSQE